MMNKSSLPGIICGVLLAGATNAEDKAILLGGGYLLEGSQAQIELNLKWVQEILESKEKSLSVFYTDGEHTNPDIFIQQPAQDSDENLHTLARVFGQHALNGISYRNHQVERVVSSTERDVFMPRFGELIEQSKQNDTLLFVYNGHGSPSKSSEDKVALKLWNDTRLPVDELHGILEKLNPQVPFRYVFTQCYSGGFHRLIYQDTAKSHELDDAMRCGFTAESAWRQSEGCSASIDIGDYRDYTTYFFAALKGEDRLGRALPASPDRDKDGITTMREAHLFTLEQAHSTDLSRSSSEYFLEQWRPWFLKWIPFSGSLPENEYSQIMSSVAERNQIDKNSLIKQVREKLREFRSRYDSLENQWLDNGIRIETLSSTLRSELLARWPQLSTPYTGAYRSLLEQESAEIQAWIREKPEFPLLKQAQDTEGNYEKQLLDLERNIAQMEKILRLRRLAYLKAWLIRHGNEKDNRSYKRLVSCESAKL